MIDLQIEHKDMEKQNRLWERIPSPQPECPATSGVNVGLQQPLPSHEIQCAYVTGISNFMTSLVVERLVEKQAKTVVLFFTQHAIGVEKRLLDRKRKVKFRQLAKAWKRETSHFSSISRRSMHMCYQNIIGMGFPAVPLLLEELKKEPDDWFWALMAITEDNPVPESAKGDVEKMAEAWLAWGRSNGLEV